MKLDVFGAHGVLLHALEANLILSIMTELSSMLSTAHHEEALVGGGQRYSDTGAHGEGEA